MADLLMDSMCLTVDHCASPSFCSKSSVRKTQNCSFRQHGFNGIQGHNWTFRDSHREREQHWKKWLLELCGGFISCGDQSWKGVKCNILEWITAYLLCLLFKALWSNCYCWGSWQLQCHRFHFCGGLFGVRHQTGRGQCTSSTNWTKSLNNHDNGWWRSWIIFILSSTWKQKALMDAKMRWLKSFCVCMCKRKQMVSQVVMTWCIQFRLLWRLLDHIFTIFS